MTLEHARSYVVPPPILRSARFYAPAAVVELVQDIASERGLALIVDVDALERTARARIDRVMTLALAALAGSGVQLTLVARDEVERATSLRRALRDGSVVDRGGLARLTGRLIAISDDATLVDDARMIVIGEARPARAGVAFTTDTSVRAVLWWLVEQRALAGERVATGY